MRCALLLFAAFALPAQTQEWQVLFDGSTWSNWTLSKVPVNTWWRIDNGWIVSIPRGQQQAGRRLATLESYGNFDLRFEWKIDKAGNSGVKYWLQRIWRASDATMLVPVTVDELVNNTGTPIGFEYQIADDENEPDARASLSSSTAALYKLLAPRKPGPVTAGGIHTSRIVVQDSRFEHWLDGRKVAEGDLRSEALRTVMRRNRDEAVRKRAQAADDRAKYNAHIEEVTAECLLRADVASSPIDFTHHYSGVSFRNIRIRRLP